MDRAQWDAIARCARGEELAETPVALIVDSPWIPGHVGVSTIDYMTLPDVWLRSNLAVEAEFPDVAFLPGFWAEMGMAAEPSGFGCRVSFSADKTPAIRPVGADFSALRGLRAPDPRREGLMPLVLAFYRHVEPRVKDAGRVIPMVAARGPLALAAHVMGVTDFLLGLKLDAAAAHEFLAVTTTVVRTWLEAQAEVLSDVRGILVLDDIAGFLSPEDYQEFAHPYLKRVFDAFPGAVKMFHNDTNNPASYPFLSDLGIHLFNFTHLQPMAKVRELVGPAIVLVGNVAPLDVLVKGSPELVVAQARACLQSHPGRRGLILSAGGGTSPGTPADSIRALARAARAP
ncbi:MAG TPA: uroporphyrinogen decarboxylase family protein [Planctomycetota bacterium]|jgi:uroporphyrinogen decarboxylase|nr:uroporphyrinogen decarboxylase family protein [Planctomycetota bacterium]OQC21867.1 MAG: methylcobalamin:coenzyme M methyltransferase [Planctomycetes bacterium ADurb.Bin069]NMD34896.1 uroporphyrinogen decarboxylase [Planctomycetota bacterium]HNR98182.1 uroporphyrinogen decarboxylase family protein [Planctomycetota bacterium]HNU24949.1 uroporphyrinogen decarboxylase family protein [Planctomycetota bacterium]